MRWSTASYAVIGWFSLLTMAACGGSSGGSTSTGSGGTTGGSSTAGTGGTAGSSGSSGGSGTVPLAPTQFDAGVPSTYGTHCPAGTSRCGEADFCCPTDLSCVANPSNQFGCGAAFCCLGCASGVTCGAGCCQFDQACTAGGSCGEALCCAPPADPQCPADTAATCPAGTTCLFNHSARACGGDFACYAASGAIACPGEVACPNGADFCPAGDECFGISGVCLAGSSGGNYCCKPVAHIGQNCQGLTCETGETCVANNFCEGSDPSATNVCYGPCGGSFPVDCGNYCCSSDFPVCAGNCVCNQ